MILRPLLMIALLLLLLLPVAAVPEQGAFVFAYFKGNGGSGLHLAYSDDGFVWQPLNNGQPILKPSVGRDKLMRDPHITLGPDGLYHMVWTSSWTEPVIGYAFSKDLVNWSEQRGITPMAHEPAARNVWAPETFYDGDSGQFLLFWATTIPGRFPETDKQGDNGLNHRMYLTTTKDFKSFTPTRVFYDQGFNVIDATIVKEGRRYIMFFKDETRHPIPQKNIRYAVSDRATGPYGSPSNPITGNYWAEGPSAIKVGKRLIVYFDKYRDRRYGAVGSTDFEQWEDISTNVKFPEGARHGTVFRISKEVLSGLRSVKRTSRQLENGPRVKGRDCSAVQLAFGFGGEIICCESKRNFRRDSKQKSYKCGELMYNAARQNTTKYPIKTVFRILDGSPVFWLRQALNHHRLNLQN